MKIEWLYEARREFAELLSYYRYQVSLEAARKFSAKILSTLENLACFPEMGVLKQETIMGKYGFRALFIEQYACIYKISDGCIYIYHITDARQNYIYNIFGIECASPVHSTPLSQVCT